MAEGETLAVQTTRGVSGADAHGNPRIPSGDTNALTVTAEKYLGFDGPLTVDLRAQNYRVNAVDDLLAATTPRSR